MDEPKIRAEEASSTTRGPQRKEDKVVYSRPSQETDEEKTEEVLKEMFEILSLEDDQGETQDNAKNKVTFVVEGEEYEADREMLSKQTDYFDVMLYGQYREAEQDRIPLPGVSIAPFRRIMSFLHNGQISEHGVLTFDKDTVYPISAPPPHDKHLRPEAGFIHHIRDFWQNNLQLLELADMYLIGKPFKDYFHQTLTADLCTFKHSCMVCNTSAMLCMVNTQHKLHVTMEYQTAIEWFQFAREAAICEEEELQEMARNYELQYAVAEKSFDHKGNSVILKSHASDHPTSTTMVALSTIITKSLFRVHVDRLHLSSYSNDIEVLSALIELATATTRFTADKLIYNNIAGSRFSRFDFTVFLKMHQIRHVYLEFNKKGDNINSFKFLEECRQLGIPVTRSRWHRTVYWRTPTFPVVLY